jgi:hypothetical protein
MIDPLECALTARVFTVNVRKYIERAYRMEGHFLHFRPEIQGIARMWLDLPTDEAVKWSISPIRQGESHVA